MRHKSLGEQPLASHTADRWQALHQRVTGARSRGCAGPGVPIPEHPYPGQKWREVRHDNTVTWLAYWKDPISQKDYKYVWLAANSLFKSDSDLAKYEKARKLKVGHLSVEAPYPCRMW